MDICRAALISVASLVLASCSDKAAPNREKDAAEEPPTEVHASQREVAAPVNAPQPPGEGKIGRDVVAFVRATRIVPAAGASTACPGCPAEGPEVLTMSHFKTDAVSCSGDTCSVLVTIRAEFNPGSGERMAGGLTGWIPPEQRSAYLSGQTPPGEQAFRVQITYKRRADAWQAAEFDRAPVE
jgi:hypothetical protein